MEMWKCGSKGKILLGKFQYFKEIFEKMFLTDTLAKTILLFQNILSILFYLMKKKLHFYCVR